MNKTELREKCKTIEQKIWDEYIDESNKSEPISDGIIDIDKYLNAQFKILWILKEPYDDFDEDGNPNGGGWDFAKHFLLDKNVYEKTKNSHSTWHPITYICHSILNGFENWDDIPYIRDKKELLNTLHSIAVINVSKLPGKTRTPDFSRIENAYEKHKELLFEQIETFNPDVIIGANTLHLFFKDLDISKSAIVENGKVEVMKHKDRVWINAYHPGQTVLKGEVYADEIINQVRQWSKTR